MNYQSNILGKIEDAGQLVQGGRIDRYWREEGLSLDPKLHVGTSKTLQSDWLHDSESALKHFNLRSIEFGNWMSQEDRANFLYGSMLSLHHLAQIFKAQDYQMGLNGKLSIALGARGKGRAAGHYEPNPHAVINITKTQGIGVLAHEWAHALDNILSFYTKSKQLYVSGGRTTRKGYDETIAKKGNWFEKQFEEFFNLLYFKANGHKTDFSLSLDGLEEYWNRRTEVFARTFEVYIRQKLALLKIQNHFLVSGIGGAGYPSEDLTNRVSKIIENIASKGLKTMASSQNLSGISTVDGFRKTLKKSANLNDTLHYMELIAKRDFDQVTELAMELEGETIEESSENIWNWLRANTKYKLDQDGIEELRTPKRSLQDAQIGIDCDDYTILISALLLNMGIPHEYRIAAYEQTGKFQHIYPVAIDKKGNEYVIDAVPEIPHFNHEAKPIIDLKTIKIMELHELSGLGATDLQNDLMQELNEPFTVSEIDDDLQEDLLESNFLSGFGEVLSEAEAEIVLASAEDAAEIVERGILAEVVKAKQTLTQEKSNPTVLSQTIQVDKELELMNDLINSWGDPDDRIDALDSAITANSSYANFFKAIELGLEQLNTSELSGIDDEPIYLARVNMTEYDLNELLEDDELEGLGRRKKKRLKNFFKKVGKGIKKVAKAVVKYNPATITLRASILLVLKLNVLKIASRLIYGYLNQSQATAQNLDMNEWQKVVKAKNKAEKFYTKIGGKASKFRSAITKGRAAKKTGLPLGVAATATAATATTAASGFIVFAKKLLSKINPVKLFKNVADKIKAKKAMNSNTEITPSTPTFNDDTDFPSPTAKMMNPLTNDELEQSDPNSMTMMQKMKNLWLKHKKKIIIVGMGGLVAIIGLVIWKKAKRKKKRSLAGIKAARTRARNRRKPSLRGTTTRRKRTYKRKTIGRGSTTMLRVPSKSVTRARVSKRSNASRLKAMHRKAQELRKKHPKSKYSTLLKRASKMI